MTAAIHDFKSIRRKLDRQEQKAEFEEKNPPAETAMYGWPLCGVAVPYGPARGWLAPDSGLPQNQYQIQAASNLFGNYNK